MNFCYSSNRLSTTNKMLMITVILIALTQVLAADEKCDFVLVDGVTYKKEILKKDIDTPYQFSIDYNSNTLFFSHTINSNGLTYQSAYINLQDKELNVISSVENGFASAVNSKNKRIFISAKGGIYEFNLKTKQTNFVGAKGENIWQMFYNNGLYYTTYPFKDINLIKDGISQKVDALRGSLVQELGVVENGDIYFYNSSGLFVYKKINKEIMFLVDQTVTGITADMNGKLYISSTVGISVIDDKQYEAKRILSIENTPYAVAVEKDGSILYGTENSIMRLRKTDKC